MILVRFAVSSIPAENFVSIQHHENKFRNGTFLVKNEFLQNRIRTLQFFREDDHKIDQILLPANTENS